VHSLFAISAAEESPALILLLRRACFLSRHLSEMHFSRVLLARRTVLQRSRSPLSAAAKGGKTDCGATHHRHWVGCQSAHGGGPYSPNAGAIYISIYL
ncbi:unnamed protein product, partial [Linum tenue]